MGEKRDAVNSKVDEVAVIANQAWPQPSLITPPPQAPLELAKRLRAERRFDEAIKVLQDEISKNNPQSAQECSVLLADIFGDIGDFERAVKVMDELIKSNPKNKAYYMKRSVFRFKLDDRKGALNDVVKARELDSKDASIVKALVDVNASLGNYDGALEALNQIESLNMVDSSVHERKKNLLHLIRLKEESDPYNFMLDAVRANTKEDMLLVAAEMFRKVKEKRNADYYEIGCALYRKLGMPYKAVELGEEAVKCGKANDKMLRTLAFAYMDTHKFEKAIELLEEISKRSKDDPGIYADLAVARLNGGDPKGALREIDKAIKLDPYREVFYMHKGDIIARVEGVQHAIKFYEKAIALNPLNQDAHDRKENAEAVIYRHAKKSDEKIFR
ncbi:MAG: tetratricopeptide repeat protein [Candidatus Micrarchaeota archaeon]|nr:tetratricopeptide repeat protein [Candidatus Micrarchaeota archaeon]